MPRDIRKQYDAFAETFSAHGSGGQSLNDKNRSHFYSFIDALPLLPKAKVLDLACGDGFDTHRYQTRGFQVQGVDASRELIRIAREKHPTINFKVGLAEILPYPASHFDAVVSKYAIMTSKDVKPIFNEVHRVLKKGGYFIYLVTHPFRQYFEKKSQDADYFQQHIVTSHILNNAVSIQEPTHTFNEYFSLNFLNKFDLLSYDEAFEPGAERIEGRTYPGYFIATCKKR